MATNPQMLLIGAGTVKTTVGTTAGNFYDLGGYRDSLSVRFSEERFNLEVADHLAYVKSVRTRLDCFVNTSLVQATFDSLQNAVGGMGNVLGSSAATLTLNIAQPTTHPLQFIGGTAGSGTTFRLASYAFSQCVPTTDAELSYAKDGETLVPASFMVLGTLSGTDLGFGYASHTIA